MADTGSSASFWQQVLLLEHSPRDIARTLGRAVFDALRPDPVLRAQAVAFLMFLAFFPALLFLVGAVAWLIPGWEELLGDLRQALPPGSRHAVLDSLSDASRRPGQLMVTGGLGVLLLGTRLMAALTRIFGFIYGTEDREPFWKGQIRAVGVVVVTVIPWVVLGLFLVLGRFIGTWVRNEFASGASLSLDYLSTVGYYSIVFLTSALVLASLYHYLTPDESVTWHNVMPGAALGMLLWWLASAGFGRYVDYVAFHSAIYGGFATAIGLLVWMFLSALVILIGARFNAGLHKLNRRSAGG